MSLGKSNLYDHEIEFTQGKAKRSEEFTYIMSNTNGSPSKQVESAEYDWKGKITGTHKRWASTKF